MSKPKEVADIIKRNGKKVPFDKKRIFVAIEKAFMSDNQSDVAMIAMLSDQVVQEMHARFEGQEVLQVESIQDIVEEKLI